MLSWDVCVKFVTKYLNLEKLLTRLTVHWILKVPHFIKGFGFSISQPKRVSIFQTFWVKVGSRKFKQFWYTQGIFLRAFHPIFQTFNIKSSFAMDFNESVEGDV